MSDEIFLDGARYVSALDAAKWAGLSRDYVTRLCKRGEVHGRLFGKSWYVEHKNFQDFLVRREFEKTKSREELSRVREKEYARGSVLSLAPTRVEKTPHRVREFDVQSALLASLHKHAVRASTKTSHVAFHTPFYTVTPLLDAFHKAIALITAFMLTFGTYAFVDPSYAREVGNVLTRAGSNVLALDIPNNLRDAEAVVARAVQNPSSVLAAAGGAGGGAESVFARAASDFNRALNEVVYRIAFPGVAVVEERSAQPVVMLAVTENPERATTSSGTTSTKSPVVRVIERIIEPQLFTSAGVTEAFVRNSISELEGRVSARFNSLSSANSSYITSNSNAMWILSRNTENIDDSNITNSDITGGTITDAAIEALSLEVTGTATSTFAGGINITGGCFAVNGTCFTGGSTPGGVTGQVQFNDYGSLGGDADFTFSTSTKRLTFLNASSTNFTTVNATTTSLFATYASTTNATSTNLFASVARLTSGIIDTLSATVATISNLTATTLSTTNATTTRIDALNYLAVGSSATTTIYGSATSTFGAGVQTTYLNVTGTAATSTFANGIAIQGGCVSVNGACLGADDFAYPFPSNATTSLLTFSGGLMSLASTTIGGGTQTSGLTISGGATTTGNAYFGGNIGIGGSDPLETLFAQKSINNSRGVRYTLSNTNTTGQSYAGAILYAANQTVASQFYADGLGTGPLGTPGFYVGNFSNHPIGFFTNNTEKARLSADGNLGIGTTSPYAKLSVVGQTVAEYFTGTSTSIASVFPYASTTAISGTTAQFTTSSSTNLTVSSIPSAILLTNSSGTAGAYSGTSCTNQFVRSINGAGVATCASVQDEDLNLSDITLADFTNDADFVKWANATSSLWRSAGLISSASSTIGNGTQAGGLTIAGGATTTGNLLVQGTASTSALVASTAFTFSNVTGFLKATAGAVATAAINFASDVTGILPVSNGGTGWSTITANTLVTGNGTSAVATTSIGNGLSLSGGVLSTSFGTTTANTWTAQNNFSALFATNASSTNATTSALYVTGLTSALSLFDANGQATEYAGTSCTNQFVRSINGAGVATCADVTLGTDTTGNFVATVTGTANQITVSGSGSENAAVTLSLPTLLAITNASSTQQSILDGLFVGRTSTTTILGSATSTFGAGLQTTYLNVTGTAATSTFANGITLSGGCFAVNGTCIGSGSGSGTVNTGTSGYFAYYPSTGTTVDDQAVLFLSGSNIGVGTTSPYAKLSVAGEIVGAKLTATSTTATSTIAGGLDVGNGALSYDFSTGLTSIQNLALGAMSFEADSGILSWIDMPVTSSASQGTVESYTAQIDSNPFLTIYSESDGSGGIQNGRVSVGTTTPYSRFSVWGAGTGTGQLFELNNSASTTVARILDNGTTYFLGNVGIGTTSPYSKLSVAGQVVAQNFVATSSTASVLPYASSTALTVSGQASTSELIASNSFTFRNVTGFLKATAGTVATALVDLAADVTGILPVSNGGTGWSTITANTLLTGNGTGAVATTSIGNGLSLSGGVLSTSFGTTTANSWSALQTFAAGASTTQLSVSEKLYLEDSSDTPLSGAQIRSAGGWWGIRMDSSSRFNVDFYNNGNPAALLSMSQIGELGVGTSSVSGVSLLVQGNDQATTLLNVRDYTESSALSVSGTGFGTTTLKGLTVSGSATSTSNVGWNLTGGCFAINGTCLSASGGSSFGKTFEIGNNIFSQSSLTPTTTLNLAITGTGTSTFAGGLEAWRQIAAPYFNATSTTATSTFAGNIQVDGLLRIGTGSTYLSGSATSTFAAGINLASGCFAVGGSCIITGGLTAGDRTTMTNTALNTLRLASSTTAVSSTTPIYLVNGVADSFMTFAGINQSSSLAISTSSAGQVGRGDGSSVVTFLTSGTSWSVPSDWNSSNNTIEVIGGGGGGGTAASQSGGGGGGGGYSKVTNVSLTPSGSVGYAVGSGGGSGVAGGDTYFCNSTSNCASILGSAVQVGAKGGGAGAGNTAGTGGAAGSGVGTTKYSGGTGGSNTDQQGGRGGGGAGGPNGDGGNGGNSANTNPVGGGGGGGANGGSAGSANSGSTGGAGGNNRSSAGSGAGGSAGNNGTAGTSGGGGGGAGGDNSTGRTGGAGSQDTIWTQTSNSATAGPGSGGGGGSGLSSPGGTGGAGGGYGGGGGGAGRSSGTGGSGSQGIIVLTYTTPATTYAIRSSTFTATTSPDKAQLYIQAPSQSAASFTLNTDLRAAVSRNGGTSWATTTLTTVGTLEDGSVVYRDDTIDLSSQSSGTSMQYRIIVENSKTIPIYGVVFTWGAVEAQTSSTLSVSGALSAASLTLSSALGVAQGGTGWAALEAGRLLFGNGSSAIATSTSLFWNNTLNRLGIGTSTPYSKLSVWGDSTGNIFEAVTSASSSALTVSGTGFGTTTVTGLNINGSATSTSNVGWNLTGGCFAINGTCLGGGGATPAGSTGQLQFNSAGALGASAQLYWDSSNSFLGIGTSSPYAKLTVWGAGTGTGTLFELANSASTTIAKFLDNGTGYFLGNIGIGTTTPYAKLSLTDAVSTAQVAIAYDATRYTNLLTNSVGDLVINPQGDDAFLNDDNFWVCTGGSCPSGNPTGTGNLVVENKLGIGTTTPNTELAIETQDSTTDFLRIASTTNQNLLVFNKSGFLGIGTSTPTQQLSIAQKLFVANGTPASAGTATSTFLGDVLITGKLDVSTIDPVYTIDGVKYATYGHSTVGVKEELAMLVDAAAQDTGGKYEYVIDFKKLPLGSDPWLFWQVSDFGANWENLVVSLTPGFDGQVSYVKDAQAGVLRVIASAPGEVSLRLIADRFDAAEWPTLRPDQNEGFKGFELEAKK